VIATAALWVAGTVLLLAPVEYLAHRLLMHHETPLAPGVYDRHARLHHRAGRLDVNVDLSPGYALLLGAPALLGLFATGRLLGLACTALTVAAYAVLWTGLHRAIHGLGGRWATRLPGYRALRRHHLAHHARQGRNFGTVFGPLLDRPLGTWHRGGDDVDR
jgi:sterol desaturase/sphingolipid hydroxylase (fatty acid hydroxylase superfamily)